MRIVLAIVAAVYLMDTLAALSIVHTIGAMDAELFGTIARALQ